MAVTVGLDTSPLAALNTGTEEVLDGLLHGLYQVGQAVVPLAPPRQALDMEARSLGLTPTARPSHRAKWRWETAGLARAAAAAGVDVVHVPYLAHPPRPLPVPTVVTVHDLIPYLYPGYQQRWRTRWYFRRLAARLPYASRLVAVSEATWHDIALVFPAWHARVVVIPNGVHPQYFLPPDAAELQSARQELGLREGEDRDTPVLLYAGGYQPHKNVPLLLKAVQAAREAMPHLRLLLAGAAGQLDEAAAPGATLLPRVSRARLAALYALATVVVCPSRYEGFGLPAAQGLAAGTPVVASDIPAHREVLGEAACLLPVDDPAAWAEALTALLQDPARRRELAAAGRERAGAFRWERAARQYQALYHGEAP